MGEYTEEREVCIDRWGVGAFHKAEEIGFLGPQVVAAHCCKLDQAELEIVARTGTQVSFNPVSNAYLGNGFPPIVRMLEMGIDVSLASDGGACGATEDMLQVLRWGTMAPKVDALDPRVFNARDALRLATMGGAQALGLPHDLGALEVGRLADLFLFDPYRLKTVPMHDPISTLVYGGTQQNVHTVIVDGKVVLDEGRLTQVDEPAFVREVHERAIALAQRIGTYRLLRGRRFTPFGYDRPGPHRLRDDAPAPPPAVAAGDGRGADASPRPEPTRVEADA